MSGRMTWQTLGKMQILINTEQGVQIKGTALQVETGKNGKSDKCKSKHAPKGREDTLDWVAWQLDWFM